MRFPSPLLIAVPLLLAACTTSGPQPPVAVNHVQTTPTPVPTPTASQAPSAPSTPAPTATPTAAAAGGPDRCHTGGLLVSFAGSQGAAGTIVDTFHVANTSQAPCTLYGYVGMLLLGAAGQPMLTRVVRNGGFFQTQAGPSQFVLQPAAAASFQAAWSDVPHTNDPPGGACPQASQLEVTPPDEFDHVIIAVHNWNLAPCNAGEIDVTPIRAAGAGPA